ncbi:MAG: aromatic amino acid transaminase [Pseudomonadota bacterium]
MPFSSLQLQPADPLLSLVQKAGADQRPSRLDLSIGVYRDDHAATPVMRAVKAAEHILADTQPTKAYLGVEGSAVFIDHVRRLVMPDTSAQDVVGIQTPGGSGALRLAAELLVAGKPDRTIWIGTPTWSNHLPLLTAGRLQARCFPSFDVGSQTVLVDRMLEAIAAASAGDAFLLQPLCHNPTGAELAPADLVRIADALAERGVVPLIDIAYHGFGASLDADSARLRPLLDRVPHALLVYSCSKNFGLYRERTGVLFSINKGGALRDLIASNLLSLARANWSMPPDHGAAIVSTILGDDRLAAEWRQELTAMVARVRAVRAALSSHGVVGSLDLGPIGGQSGMFSLLPLGADLAARLRRDHAIYIPDSGRINIAGLGADRVEGFVAALRQSQMQSAA